MTSTELIQIFDDHPRSRFRLKLSSGDVVDVDNPSRTIIQELALYVGQSDDPESQRAQRIRFVSISKIALVEEIDPNRPRNGRRRRR